MSTLHGGISLQQGGTLLCTVLTSDDIPLAIFAVVLRSPATVDAWAMLVAQFGALTAQAWIADVEQCIAWAWAERLGKSPTGLLTTSPP